MGSFLRRLLGGGNNIFNIEELMLDKLFRMSMGIVGYLFGVFFGEGVSMLFRSVNMLLLGFVFWVWLMGLVKFFSFD